MKVIFIILFFLALPANGQEETIDYLDDTEVGTSIYVTTGSLNRFGHDYACIDTEICGDATGDLSVRCVRVRICGEAIR